MEKRRNSAAAHGQRAPLGPYAAAATSSVSPCRRPFAQPSTSCPQTFGAIVLAGRAPMPSVRVIGPSYRGWMRLQRRLETRAFMENKLEPKTAKQSECRCIKSVATTPAVPALSLSLSLTSSRCPHQVWQPSQRVRALCPLALLLRFSFTHGLDRPGAANPLFTNVFRPSTLTVSFIMNRSYAIARLHSLSCTCRAQKSTNTNTNARAHRPSCIS